MKKGILAITVISVCLTTFGQKTSPAAFQFQIAGRKTETQLPVADQQKIVQYLNESFFFNRITGFRGFKPAAVNNIFSRSAPCPGSFFSTKKEHTDRSSPVYSRLSILARGFPFFLGLLTKENKVALKLACQKTSFGASNKACKKVTGITFALPIATTQ